MEITNVRVFKTTSDMFVGNGSVEFDGVFFVKFKVVKSSKDGSLFISWPSTKGKDKETGGDKWFPEAGFVLGEDEETKYEFKNYVDEYLIKEFNKIAGVPASENKPKDKGGDEGGSKPKSSVTMNFGPKGKGK